MPRFEINIEVKTTATAHEGLVADNVEQARERAEGAAQCFVKFLEEHLRRGSTLGWQQMMNTAAVNLEYKVAEVEEIVE